MVNFKVGEIIFFYHPAWDNIKDKTTELLQYHGIVEYLGPATGNLGGRHSRCQVLNAGPHHGSIVEFFNPCLQKY
jgi:hypothetical protein